MNGSGGYPNPTWTVSAGGRSSDNIESNDNGYWLLVANGSTNYDLKHYQAHQLLNICHKIGLVLVKEFLVVTIMRVSLMNIH